MTIELSDYKQDVDFPSFSSLNFPLPPKLPSSLPFAESKFRTSSVATVQKSLRGSTFAFKKKISFKKCLEL